MRLYFLWTILLFLPFTASAQKDDRVQPTKIVYKDRPLKVNVINRPTYQHDGYYSYRQYYRSYYNDPYYYQYREPTY